MAKKDPSPFDGMKELEELINIDPPDYVSTGIYLLDGIFGRVGKTGRRGLGLGKMVEIFGDNRVCKSELVRNITNSFMRQRFANFGGVMSATPNGVLMFADQEQATDTAKMREAMRDITRARFAKFPSLEHFYVNLAKFMTNMEKNSFPAGLSVMDSVASCFTLKELKKEVKDEQVPAAKAQIHSRALPKLRGMMAKTNTLSIFVNQIRDKIDSMQDADSSGGKAIKFYSDYRCKLRHVSNYWIKSGIVRPDVDFDEPNGMVVEIQVIKNKVDMPMRKLKLYMLFRPSQGHPSGLSPMWTMFHNLKDYDYIKVKGGRNQFDGNSFSRAEWATLYKEYTDDDGMPKGALLAACDSLLSKLMPDSFEFEEDSDEEEDDGGPLESLLEDVT